MNSLNWNWIATIITLFISIGGLVISYKTYKREGYSLTFHASYFHEYMGDKNHKYNNDYCDAIRLIIRNHGSKTIYITNAGILSSINEVDIRNNNIPKMLPGTQSHLDYMPFDTDGKTFPLAINGFSEEELYLFLKDGESNDTTEKHPLRKTLKKLNYNGIIKVLDSTGKEYTIPLKSKNISYWIV